MLPLWTDELFTVQVVPKPLPDLLQDLRRDIHPPLYFLLAKAALAVPLPFTCLEKIRLLSALLALAAGFALDRLWFRHRPERHHLLALWSLSPVILLYGRMARSYSLQILMFTLAAAAALHWLNDAGNRRKALLFTLAELGLLYSHYVPGLALGAAIAISFAFRIRNPRAWITAVAAASLVAAGYLPWLAGITEALAKWSSGSAVAVSPTGPADQFAKAAYTAWTFALSESTGAPIWLALLVTATLAVFTVRGLGQRPDLWPLLAAAPIAWLGVTKWVGIPFVPARILFLFPFFWMLVLAGVPNRARLAVTVALCLFQTEAILNYWRQDHYLNKGYAVPLPEIGRIVQHESGYQRALVLIDPYNTDVLVLREHIYPPHDHIFLWKPDLPAILEQASTYQIVWLIRNTRDASPNQTTDAVEKALAERYPSTRRGFTRLSPRDKQMLSVSGPPQSDYFYRLVQFRVRH
jgi:hypothetical protein